MDATFDESELLLRAVYPRDKRPNFWIGDRLSSAALRSRSGLSVNRTGDRSLQDSIDSTVNQGFEGPIVSISVRDCNEVKAYLNYCPRGGNDYHSQIQESKETMLLSKVQAIELSRRAKVELWR